MSVEVVVAIVTLAAAPLAAAVSWRLMKKNHSAEAESTYAQAANLSVDTMMTVLAPLKAEIASLRSENEWLTKELRKLRKMIANLGGDPSRGRRRTDSLLNDPEDQ